MGAELGVKLGAALQRHRKALGSRNTVEREAAEVLVIEDLLDAICTGNTCVVRADPMRSGGLAMFPGQFGTSEPWPEDR